MRPSVFPGGDKIGLDADDDEACCMEDGVRVTPKCTGVWWCVCKCDCWCNECNFVWDPECGANDDIDPLPMPVAAIDAAIVAAAADDDANAAVGVWWWCWCWCKWCISERLAKETPSSGWLLCTITLLLVACVWCDVVDDGWPPEISIIFAKCTKVQQQQCTCMNGHKHKHTYKQIHIRVLHGNKLITMYLQFFVVIV